MANLGGGNLDGMDGYDAVRKTTGLRDRSEEGRLRVTGPDRVTWLQGLLTNDVAALTPGGGCYAAWLTPQGRMITDVRVLERGDHMLLDLPAALRATVLERLSMFIIMEDVAVVDVTDTLARLALHGSGAAALLAAAVDLDAAAGAAADVDAGTGAAQSLTSLEEHANVGAQFRGQPIVIAGARDLGVTGFDIYVPHGAKADLERFLIDAGAAPIGTDAWHTLRVEAGRPLFGVDMTTDTIPLEAGIEDRAISLTKGCYVGQEIIIRVLHRGGGRVARKLVSLHPAPGAPTHAEAITAAAPIAAGDKSIGQVTSAAWSPRLGHWIAMGYVHRDFAESGKTVTIGAAPSAVDATVV